MITLAFQTSILGWAQVPPSGSTVRYVNPDNVGPVVGTSWGTGFRSLTDALDPAVNTLLQSAPVSSVEIRVKGGVHRPKLPVSLPPGATNPRQATFFLHGAIAHLSGGWDGTEGPSPRSSVPARLARRDSPGTLRSRPVYRGLRRPTVDPRANVPGEAATYRRNRPPPSPHFGSPCAHEPTTR